MADKARKKAPVKDSNHRLEQLEPMPPSESEEATQPPVSDRSIDRVLTAEEEDEPRYRSAPRPEAPPVIRHEERLQKIIAAAGVTSRRKAEELITGGRVQVNGTTIVELGAKADAAIDHIRVDGKLLPKPGQGSNRLRYAMLNKPKGYITTVSDPEGRPTVMEFFPGGTRVFPVGRLDYQSEGLLLMTNDGDLAHLLTRAATKVQKVYLVKVSGKPSEEALDQLRAGIMIDKGRTRDEHLGRVLTQPAGIRRVRDAENPWYEVTLTEGRNREIRKMFEEVGHFVEKIRRVEFGPLVLDIAPGEVRELTADEVVALQRSARGIRSGSRRLAPPISVPPPKKPIRKPAAPGKRATARPGSQSRPSSPGTTTRRRPTSPATTASGGPRSSSPPRSRRSSMGGKGTPRTPVTQAPLLPPQPRRV